MLNSFFLLLKQIFYYTNDLKNCMRSFFELLLFTRLQFCYEEIRPRKSGLTGTINSALWLRGRVKIFMLS